MGAVGEAEQVAVADRHQLHSFTPTTHQPRRRLGSAFAEEIMTPDSHTDTEATVLIHGNAWKVKDIYDEVSFCLKQQWHQEEWKPTPALVHKVGGTRSHYHGQKYDSEKIDFVADGWTHDHCAICWWTLHKTDIEDEKTGYRNESNVWLCAECFRQFIEADIRDKMTANKSP